LPGARGLRQPVPGTQLLDRVGHLRLSFVHRVDDPNLQVSVVASSDLHAPADQWETLDQVLSTSERDLPVGLQRSVVRDSTDDSVYQQRFLRIRVDYTP
jgi:hypothetical protein